MMDISPARTVAVQISANLRAVPSPTQPNMARHSWAVGRWVPPPTVPTMTFGSVTVAGVFQSTATGATISFQNSSGNFQVDGSGNVSGGGQANFSGGYLISGVASLRRSGGVLQWSSDGSTWNTFSSGGTPPGGSDTHVQYNSGGSVAGSGNHVWNNAAQLLTVYAASSGSAGLAVATGFIQADTGFYATSGVATSYQTFNAPTGGMYARSVRATVYSQVGQNYGAPTMTSGDSGRFLYAL